MHQISCPHWRRCLSCYAETLRDWLPKVIQAISPWMSQDDIASGTRWYSEIANELEVSTVGIVCVTPENQHNPWIMFEAGALSKTLKHTYLCPYLFDMNASQLSGPLSQFQANESNKEGTHRIVSTLNFALGTQSLDQKYLDEIFEVWWPKLDNQLQLVPEYKGESHDKRPTEELLDEIVKNTREQLRREEVRLIRSTDLESQIGEMINVFEMGYKNAIKQFEHMLKSNALISGSEESEMDVPSPMDVESFSKLVIQMRGIQEKGHDYTKELLSPKNDEESDGENDEN
jgi:hypothetical protein